MRVVALFLILMSSACQTAPKTAVPAAQTWQVFSRTHDTFIVHRDQELAKEAARHAAAGLEKDRAYIRAQVDALLPPGNYTMQATGATAAIWRRQRVETVTNILVRAGYRARHFATPQQARSLVSAASNIFGDADALVLLAPIILVADLDRTERRPDCSAYLVYRASEAIKSAPPLGSEFRLMLHGPMPKITRRPGDPPPPPPPPNPPIFELAGYPRALFFLQPRETMIDPLIKADTGIGYTLFGPMPIRGDRLLPGYHSGTPETTLDAIRATARAQLCSPGYVPVAVGTNLAQKC